MNRLGKLFVAAAIAVVPVGCKDEIRKDADKAAEDLREAKEELREESKELKEAVDEQTEDSAELAKSAHDRDDENRVAGLTDRAATEVNEKEVSHDVKEIAEETKDVAKQSETVAVKEANFEIFRFNRTESLRAAHTVAASQPMLINAISQMTPLTDKARADLAEKMQVFQMRIDEAGNTIQALQTVDESNFEDHNDKAAKAMERLEDAREDAWESLDDGDRIEPS